MTRFLLTFIVGLAIIWIGFWWYAESRLQSGFIAWANRHTATGWQVSYSGVHRGTSPADAALTVDDFSLTSPAGATGKAFNVVLPQVALRISALNPLVFHLDLPPKIVATGSNGIQLVFNIGSSDVRNYLDPKAAFNREAYPFRGGDFTLNDIDVLFSGSLLLLHIDALVSHSSVNMHAGAGQIAGAESLRLDGLAVSPLLTRAGGIPFGGKLAKLEVDTRLSGPVPADFQPVMTEIGAERNDLAAQRRLLIPLLHEWAAAGGNGNIGVDLVVGPSSLQAAGSVRFDANLQPNGTMDLSANHLDQFTQAVGNAYPATQPYFTQAAAELSPYLSDSPSGGQQLSVHGTYGSGGVVVNGQKAADMPVVNWQALENPPPAAIPQAPQITPPTAPPASAPASP